MLVAQLCLTLCDPMECSLPGSSVHGFPSKNTGVGCHSLLNGIFLTKGLNVHCLLYLQADSLPSQLPGKSFIIPNMMWMMCVHACSVTQLCLTLCDPMDYSLPESSVLGISQARILEWVAISNSYKYNLNVM